jgi:hypothetical protein
MQVVSFFIYTRVVDYLTGGLGVRVCRWSRWLGITCVANGHLAPATIARLRFERDEIYMVNHDSHKSCKMVQGELHVVIVILRTAAAIDAWDNSTVEPTEKDRTDNRLSFHRHPISSPTLFDNTCSRSAHVVCCPLSMSLAMPSWTRPIPSVSAVRCNPSPFHTQKRH